MTGGNSLQIPKRMAFSVLFWYNFSMRNDTKAEKTAVEATTVSREEYKALLAENTALKEHNAELERKLQWLTEQYILAKHGKYAFASEQQEQLVIDGF